MTTSLKGGGGKSFFAAALLDHLRTRGRKVFAFDGDVSNGSLAALHATKDADGNVLENQCPDAGVGIYNIRNETRDALINSLNGTGIILHDLAGGSLQDLQRIFGDQEGLLRFFEAAQRLNVQIVFAHLVTPDAATVNSVAHHLDLCEELGALGALATHVAVLNRLGERRDGDFTIWFGDKAPDGSVQGGATRKRLLDGGGGEMNLPALSERTVALVKQRGVPFSRAATDPSLALSDQQRILSFMSQFEHEIRRASPVMGLNL